jgi:hypothetical protein
MAVHTKAQRYFRGAFDAVDADFTVTLGGVRVPGGEQGALVEYGQVERGSGAELAYVHVAAEGAGRAGSELTVFSRGNAHHSTERAQGDDGRSQRTGYLGVERPVKEIGLTESVFQEAEAGDHAGPAPTAMFHLQHLNLEYVAGLGSFDSDGAGECVDPVSVDSQKVFDARTWFYLAAAGVEAAHVHGVAGGDRQAWFEGAVPAGMSGLSS